MISFLERDVIGWKVLVPCPNTDTVTPTEVGDMTALSAGGKGLKCLDDVPEGNEARCPQYFIKWARYSHIHNTWETDLSLEEKGCKGLKILENYQKKQQETEDWSVNYLLFVCFFATILFINDHFLT